MKLKRVILALALLVAGLIFVSGLGRATAQGQNLLTNPGFEGQYSSYVPETPQEVADCPLGVCTTAQMPPGWKPWWVKERPTDVNPEYKPAERNVGGNRVLSGDRAAQYFSFWKTHKAGLRQTVNVPSYAVVQFTIWGHGWLSELDEPLTSDTSGTLNMRIGIDPTGSSNPFNPAIVWSEFRQAYDQFQPFSVQAQAQGDRVTVFTFSAPSASTYSPEFGFKHTDIYWDDASLSVVGSAPPPPPPPSDGQPTSEAARTVPFIPLPTSTPDAEGVIYHVVQPGDSLWAIAARAGIALDELLELNGLDRNHFVQPGDLIITGFGDLFVEEAVEEEAAETEVVEEARVQPTVTPAATPTPAEIALVAADETGGTICLTAYEDSNRNGQRDSGEPLMEAVAFTISDGEKVASNYVTDGASEPFCIKGLEEGSYRVARSRLDNEVMTTPGDQSVAVSEEVMLNLEFGSYFGEALAEVAPAEQASALASAADELAATALEEPETDGGSVIGVMAVVIAVIFLVGVLVVILSSRRAAQETQ